MSLIAIPDVRWFPKYDDLQMSPHLQIIILWGFLVCKYEFPCIHDVIPVYIENNFDCNVHVWSPVFYSLTRSSHLSISWNRSNKYKTLLHNPSFATSYIHIKIIVTNKICYCRLSLLRSRVVFKFLSISIQIVDKSE